MYSEGLRKWKQARLRQVANAGAPAHAGLRGASWEQARQNPTAFFRLKRKLPWQPDLAQESALVLQRGRTALLSMIKPAPTQRERLVLLLLHQTAARISEILGRTAGGYRKAHSATQALVTDKGSMGIEEKRIYFTPAIEQLLVQYMRTERVRFDSQGRKHLEQLADHEPLFFTRRGTPYTRSSWYSHWNKWLAAVPSDELTSTLGPVLFTPQAIRPWSVSWLLRQMKQRSANAAAKRAALPQRRGWRSPLTRSCSEQSAADRERLEVWDGFLHEIEHQAEQNKGHPKPVGRDAQPPSPPRLSSVTEMNASVPVLQRALSDLAFWEQEPGPQC